MICHELIPAGPQGDHFRLGLITLRHKLLLTSFQFGHLLVQPLCGFRRGCGGIREGSPACHRKKAQDEAESPEQSDGPCRVHLTHSAFQPSFLRIGEPAPAEEKYSRSTSPEATRS